MALYLSV